MFTLIACKNNIAHMAIAAAVLSNSVQLVWYAQGEQMPDCSLDYDGDVVVLEPPQGWETAVSLLVEMRDKVWRFKGSMYDVGGVEWLGDDLLHGLHYAVHVPLVSPLNSQMKQMIMNRLNGTPQIVGGSVIAQGELHPLALTTMRLQHARSERKQRGAPLLSPRRKCLDIP